MPATDYTPPNLSHFTSQDYWFSGALESLSTGWLGRWLDLYGSTNEPAAGHLDRLLAVEDAAQRAGSGLHDLVAVDARASRSNAGGGAQGGNSAAVDPNAVLAQLAALPAGNPALAHTRDAYGLAVGVQQQTQRARATRRSAPATRRTPTWPTSCSSPRSCSAAGFGTRVITINWGGFDTHGDQISTQDPQLVELSRCLGAFQADLAARGIDGQVATLMFSEFGRRASRTTPRAGPTTAPAA